jgi:hypothetical protein
METRQRIQQVFVGKHSTYNNDNAYENKMQLITQSIRHDTNENGQHKLEKLKA